MPRGHAQAGIQTRFSSRTCTLYRRSRAGFARVTDFKDTAERGETEPDSFLERGSP